MNDKIQPTPAVALGSYDITPLEAAGAYTVFANGGEYVKPNFINSWCVRAGWRSRFTRTRSKTKKVLDPRVAYMMTNMMEEVLRSGTAAGVRAKYKFDVPAAGKTGTSRDGWFAGYTSELLCIVWVGFDDNRDLDLEGAHSAAPIWAEFMKRALDFREYRDTKPFHPPDGIVTHRHRSALRHARDAAVSHRAARGLYRRYAAGRSLPITRRAARHHKYYWLEHGSAARRAAAARRRNPSASQAFLRCRSAPTRASDGGRFHRRPKPRPAKDE